MRILLVEDEEILCEALSTILKKNKFAVDIANDGLIGFDLAQTGIYDVIILDRMLPSKDGVEILRDIRKKSITTPVIFLTAKDTIENRVEGLENGADDYLVKPFATEELIARIKALYRRKTNEIKNETYCIGAISFDPSLSQIMCNNKIIKLTFKEVQLLEFFILNINQVLSKNQILDKVWGFDCDVDDNSVEIYVYYLRKKLSSVDSKISIETIRGIGYCLKTDDCNR